MVYMMIFLSLKICVNLLCILKPKNLKNLRSLSEKPRCFPALTDRCPINLLTPVVMFKYRETKKKSRPIQSNFCQYANISDGIKLFNRNC